MNISLALVLRTIRAKSFFSFGGELAVVEEGLARLDEVPGLEIDFRGLLISNDQSRLKTARRY